MKNHSKTNKTESAKKQLVKTEANSAKTNIVSSEIRQLAERLSRSLREQANNCQAMTAAVKENSFCVGIDLGDKKSNYCFLNAKGNIIAKGTLRTRQAEFNALFALIPRCRIAIEVGTHSPWVSALLESCLSPKLREAANSIN